MSLAIEVKLAQESHGASDIQEEMHADITAYKTKWKRLMFVIYDVGVVADPHRMIRENQRLFGISVLVIKHYKRPPTWAWTRTAQALRVFVPSFWPAHSNAWA